MTLVIGSLRWIFRWLTVAITLPFGAAISLVIQAHWNPASAPSNNAHLHGLSHLGTVSITLLLLVALWLDGRPQRQFRHRRPLISLISRSVTSSTPQTNRERERAMPSPVSLAAPEASLPQVPCLTAEPYGPQPPTFSELTGFNPKGELTKIIFLVASYRGQRIRSSFADVTPLIPPAHRKLAPLRPMLAPPPNVAASMRGPGRNSSAASRRRHPLQSHRGVRRMPKATRRQRQLAELHHVLDLPGILRGATTSNPRGQRNTGALHPA